jgi:hypothetical protein
MNNVTTTAPSNVPTPVTAPAAWRGEGLQTRTEEWLRQLSQAQIDELEQVSRQIEAAGLTREQIDAAQWPLPAMEASLAEWRQQIHRGHGMILVRGLPARRMGKSRAGLAYWLLGLHLGAPVPQNAQGETLVDIRDLGHAPNDHNVRLYKTRADLSFHTDGADIIGLLCLREGKSGGVSRICSSVEVYNEVLRRCPDLAPLLEDEYHHHAHGQFGADGPKTFRYPIVTRRDGLFRMMLLIWYIRNAAEDFPDIAPLTPAQHELLDLLEQIPLEPGVALDMQFQEGDMQFLKNSVVLHARTEYADWDEPEEKRHLLRLWLSAPDFADGDDLLRHGFAGKAAA